MRLPVLPARLAQIDLLKGLAILAVLGLHTLTARQLELGGGRFWIGQAVPVFVVLMGLNATASMFERAKDGLAAVYTRSYLLGRLDRLYVPFLAVFAISALIAAAEGTLTGRALAGGLVTGLLPYSGPGNYFITFAFEFAVVFPLLIVAFQRAPTLTTVSCFGLAIAAEALAPHLDVLIRHPYVWDSSIVRLLPFVLVGMLLASLMLTRRPLPRWWWGLTALGIAYLVALTVDDEALEISIGGWRSLGQTSIVAFYSGALTAVGLRFLPEVVTSRPAVVLTELGRCSYEIFLLQILWFSLVDAQRLWVYPVTVAVCCAAGWLLHRTVVRLPSLEAAASRLGRA